MSATPGGTGTEPVSDEEMQEIWVGPIVPHNAPIVLADYDAGWPVLFDREASRIRSVLGETALRVEHVGSTSVPGLAAKPIIDIVLVVPSSADEPSYRPALEAAGYVLRIREPDWYEHRVFKGPDTNINLHVFSLGAAEIDRVLRFRDRLRADDADRDYYARAKRELAGRVWRHVQHYADAKTAVVEEIMARAGAAGIAPPRRPVPDRPVLPEPPVPDPPVLSAPPVRPVPDPPVLPESPVLPGTQR